MRRALAIATTGVLLLASACQKQNQKKDELSAALYKTETMPRTFTLVERSAGGVARATAVVEDDYRFRIDLTFNGRSASEVVVDDARAVRADKERVIEGLDISSTAASSDYARLPLELRSELEGGKWIVDPKGANALFGDSPVRGARADEFASTLAVLQSIRLAMGEAAGVVGFNPESQDYRPKFDPFPPPPNGAMRYDLVPPTLTPRDPTTTSGAAQQLPGPRYFRRTAVYVRDGVVSEIRGRVSVEDALNDPRSRLAARIGDYGITLPDASMKEQASFLVERLNASATRLNQAPVIVHDIYVRFDDVGVRRTITLPKDAKRGSLAGVRDNSQILYETPG